LGKSDVMNGFTVVTSLTTLVIIVVIGCSSAQLVQREHYLKLPSTVKKILGAGGILKNILQEIFFSKESIRKKIVPLVPKIVEVPVQSTVSRIIRELKNPRNV
jgi:urea transporter